MTSATETADASLRQSVVDEIAEIFDAMTCSRSTKENAKAALRHAINVMNERAKTVTA